MSGSVNRLPKDHCLVGLWQQCRSGNWEFLELKLSRKMSEAAARSFKLSEAAAVPQWTLEFHDHGDTWIVELDQSKPKTGHDFTEPIHALAIVDPVRRGGSRRVLNLRIIPPEKMFALEPNTEKEENIDAGLWRRLEAFMWFSGPTPLPDSEQVETEKAFRQYLEDSVPTDFTLPDEWDPTSPSTLRATKTADSFPIDFEMFCTREGKPVQRVYVAIDGSTESLIFETWERSMLGTDPASVCYQELPTIFSDCCDSFFRRSIAHHQMAYEHDTSLVRRVDKALVYPTKTGQLHDSSGLLLDVPEGEICAITCTHLTDENAVRLPSCQHWFTREGLLEHVGICSTTNTEYYECILCTTKVCMIGNRTPELDKMEWSVESSEAKRYIHVDFGESRLGRGVTKQYRLPMRLDGVMAFILLRRLFRSGEFYKEDDIGLAPSRDHLRRNNKIVETRMPDADYFFKLRTLGLSRGVTMKSSDPQLAKDTLAYFAE